MNRGARTGLWILIVAVVVVLFVVTGARRLRKEEVQSVESVQKAEGIPVDVVHSRVMPVEDWRQFVGVAEGYDQIDLVAPFRTRVRKTHVSVGDEVRAGTVLISLDPYDPARIAMNLNTARTQYETAREDSLRIEALFANGAVSQQDLDHVRAGTAAARAQYLTARRAVELDTPVAGVVTALSVKTGDYADGDQTLATVASYDRIRIPLDLSESERSRVRVGQAVRLRLEADRIAAEACTGDGRAAPLPESGPGRFVLTGRVVKAALSADPDTRLFDVEVVVDNPDHILRPGTLVTPEIRVASTEDRPVVPPVALMKHDGQERLYVIEDVGGSPTARLQDVVRGIENGVLVSISEGLAPGDVVVVWGQNNLKAGAKVKIHADRTADYFESSR